MLIRIDFSSEVPIYLQLKDEIIKCIAGGAYREGDYLPPIRQLGTELGINMHTVNKAYAILRENGLVSFDRRKGMRVLGIGGDGSSGFAEKIRADAETHVAQAICSGMAEDEYVSFCRELFEAFSKERSL